MAVTVTVGTVPGTLQSVALLDNENTVNDALDQAMLSASGYSITVNGNVADGGTALRNGDTVLLTRQVKGN